MIKTVLLMLLAIPMLAMNLELKNGTVSAHTEMLLDKAIDPINNALHADITIENNDIASIRGKFWVEMELFTSDKKDRDDHMYKEVETDKFKLATYTIKSVAKTDQEGVFKMDGELDFHGVKKELGANAKISTTNGSLVIEADSMILVSDYGIEMPCMMFMCVRDQVDLLVKAEF